MCAFDLPDAVDRNAFVKRCFTAGLFVLAGGARTVRLRPALTVTEDLVVEALARLRRALSTST
jgi:L-lysine 6-transaminase